MTIQLTVIAICLLSIFYLKCTNLLYRQKYYLCLYIVLFLCICQSGLRHESVGNDTFAYGLSFQNVVTTSWSALIDNFYNVYVLGIGKDAGYDFVVKIFQVFSTNYQIFLLSIALAFFLSLKNLFLYYTYTLGEILLSLLIYQVLFYGFFSITGLRQTIATIFTFISVKYIYSRNFIPFLILIFLASFIHKSVLVFLPFYFLAMNKYQKEFLGLSLLCFPLLLLFARPFAKILASISGSNEYMLYAESSYETSGAQNFALFMLLTSLWTFVLLLKKKDIDPLLTNAVTLALIFTPLTWVDPSLMRVVQYFSIFVMFLFVRLVYFSTFRIRYISLILFSLLFIVIIIKRAEYYMFYWQI